MGSVENGGIVATSPITIPHYNLQEVYTAGKRARDLVKQILAFARQSDAEIKPVRISTIAKE